MVLLGGAMSIFVLLAGWRTTLVVHDTTEIIILVGMSFAVALTVVYHATMALRGKIVLTPLAIEVHGLLKVKSIPRHEIAGYRAMYVLRYKILELRMNRPKPKVESIVIYFFPDDPFVNWFEGIENFGHTELASWRDPYIPSGQLLRSMPRSGVSETTRQFDEDRPTLGLKWVLTSAFFWALISYCIYGAAREKLFIPHLRSPGHDVYMSGPAAWTFAAGFITMWLAISLRMGLFQSLSSRARSILEMLLLFAAVAMVSISFLWLPNVASA
jgi:hypothetical protein